MENMISSVSSFAHPTICRIYPSKLEAKMARVQNNYKGNAKVNVKEKEHDTTLGVCAVDCACNVQAYNHVIRSYQHCLVLFSLVTKKPLCVIGHQTSYWRCSHALTLLMEEKE